MLLPARLLAAVLVAAIALAPAALSAPGSRAFVVETVEVSAELGFNPTVCRMNREFVRFHNVGSETIRVGRPGIVGEPPFDVQVIEPGGYSLEFSIPYGGTTRFINVDNPAQYVTIVTPVFVTYWDPICTPDPNYQPPQPPCRTNPHCNRLPALAMD